MRAVHHTNATRARLMLRVLGVLLAFLTKASPAEGQTSTASGPVSGGIVTPMAGNCDEDPPEAPGPCGYYRCLTTGWALVWRATGAACDDGNACTYNTTCNAAHACVGGSAVSCSAAQCLACNNTAACVSIPGCTITAATPTFSPAAGTYTTVQSVSIASSTPGATLYYTTNGSTPTTASTLYTGTVSVGSTKTLKAIATAAGYGASAVGSAAYTINLPAAATPTFSPAAGTYAGAQSVTMASTSPGVTLYYTADGSTPTTSSTVYAGAVAVSSNKTLKAIATGGNYSQSVVGTATYTIEAATPTFSPVGGTYTSVQTVSMSSSTGGATLFYTTDGSTPTTSSTQYTGPVSVGSTKTLRAIATAAGYGTSGVRTATYTITLPVAATPTFSPVAGTYAGPQSVTMSSTSPGVTIYYTTNGSTPTTSSWVYTGAVPVSNNKTVKAIAVGGNYSQSPVGSAAYSIAASTPIFYPEGGTYTSEQTVSIGSTTNGAVFYYTTDGSTPTTSSTPYNNPIIVRSSKTLKAISTATGWGTSAVGSATYTINLPAAATPIFSPVAGTYAGAQSVYMGSTSPGVTIYYTTDGSAPTTSSTVYTGAVAVSSNKTLKAIAAGGSYSQSAVGTATYTISAAVPTFSPVGGTYASAQTVSMTSSTGGATLYYTTDGSTPTTSSTQYTGPVSVGSSKTLKAIAIAAGYGTSAVGSAAYTINLPAAARPTFNPTAGTYAGAQSVTMASTSPGVTIYYTTDGSAPTTNSTVYTGAVAVTSSETLKAIAAGGSFSQSAAGTATYTILKPDFAIAALANTDRVSTGGPFSIQYTIMNGGSALAPPSKTCFYLSTTGSIEPLNLIGVDQVPAITAGSSAERAYKVTLPAGYSGDYQLIAEADCADEVAEENPSNNTALGTAVSVVPDVQPPDFTVVSPSQGSTVASNTIEVTLAASDDTGVAGVEIDGIQLVGGSGGTWRAAIPLPLEGQNVLEISAADLGGFARGGALVVNRDTEAPLLTVTSPEQGAATQQDRVKVTGLVGDASVVSLTVNGVGTPVQQDGGYFGSVALVVGTNDITIVATDRAGNSTSQTRTVTREGAPFEVVLLSPWNGFTVALELTLVTGTIAGGTPPYSVFANGVSIPVDSGGNFSGFVELGAGEAVVQVQAIDANSASTTVVVVGYQAMASIGEGESSDARFCSTPTDMTTLIYDAAGNWLGAVDTSSDPQNCGCVGRACSGAGAACVAGNCGISDGNGGLIDTSTNAYHCGGYGKVCPSTSHGSPVCSQGTCGVVCESGFVAAGLACIDLTSDPTNCGYRYYRCPGVDEGDATCTNGVCGRNDLPAVTEVNGVAVPGIGFRHPTFGGMRLVGTGLEKVTRVELEDWGPDTIGGVPGAEASVPVFTGTTVLAPFAAQPNELTIYFSQSLIPTGRWQKAKLHYLLSGVEATLEVDVAVSFWEAALPAPAVAGIDAIRVLAVGRMWEAPSYDPWTGFLRTNFDPRQLQPPPTALLGSDAAQTEYPILRVTKEGLFLRAGIPPGALFSYVRVDAEHEYPVVKTVTPYSYGQSENVHLGFITGSLLNADGFGSGVHNGVIIRGTNFACDVPVSMITVPGGVELPMQHNIDGPCSSSRLVVETADEPLEGDAIIRVGSPPDATQSEAPLHWSGPPTVLRVGGTELTDNVLPLRWGLTYEFSGSGFAEVDQVGLFGLGLTAQLVATPIDSGTLRVTMQFANGQTLCNSGTAPLTLRFGIVTAECPMGSLNYFRPPDAPWAGGPEPLISCLTDMYAEITGLPRCPAPPKPGDPPPHEEPPPAPYPFDNHWLNPGPLPPWGPNRDCTNSFCTP